MILEKDGLPIGSVDEWGRLAGPKRTVQWKPGRSAYELAHAWCRAGPAVPAEVANLLESHHATRGATVTWGTPELRIHFDSAGGEPRNADLALLAECHGQPVAITVEGKADEPFGNLVSEVLADAVDRGLGGRSQGVRRVTELAASLLPPRGGEKASRPPLKRLRYQLLTALAGSIAFAAQHEAKHAVLIIHEFLTDLTADRKHRANGVDLDLFVRRLTAGRAQHVTPGQLMGPIRIPGSPLFSDAPDLYIGKIVSNCRHSAS